MKVLHVSTERPNLRSEIVGWTMEDSDLFVPKKEIGYTPSPLYSDLPGTVLEALANGWKLLAPPEETTTETYTTWGWWLTKE